MLDNALNQWSKFKTINCVKIDNESPGTPGKDNEIRFKTLMWRPILCDYGDEYILAKGTITAANTATEGAAAANAIKKVIFKNCALFTNCISKINNTQVDNTHDTDIVMSMYNYFIMYNASDNYSKTSGRDEPALDNNNAITNFNTINFTTNLFKIKEKITFKMPLVNCEIYLDLN